MDAQVKDASELDAMEMDEVLGELLGVMAGLSDDALEVAGAYIVGVTPFIGMSGNVADVDDLLDVTAARMVDPCVLTALHGRADKLLLLLPRLEAGALRDEYDEAVCISSLDDAARAEAAGLTGKAVPELRNRVLDRLAAAACELRDGTYRGYRDVYGDMSVAGPDGDVAGFVQGLLAPSGRLAREVADYAEDVRKLALDGNEPVERKRGMFQRRRSSRAYQVRQADVFRAMAGEVRSAADVETWFSRFMLGPAIEAARDGYHDRLSAVASLGDGDIVELCAATATGMSIQASPGDFNVDAVRRSMRQLCRARTGYNLPLMYLISILPENEFAKLAGHM